MPTKPTHPVNMELFCPFCNSPGMRLLTYVAESGAERYICMTCRKRTTQPMKEAKLILPELDVNKFKCVKRFIVTSAVNDTPLVLNAHNTLKKMAELLGAEYLIIPGVYKNPDISTMGSFQLMSWPKEIIPYSCNGDLELSDSIVIRGLTRIVYTAINPLSGMNHAGDIRSEIYGHPQVAMNLVATPKEMMPKMLHTTGSISEKNYGGSKTAKKASFHHSLGGLLIEVEGDKFWVNNLSFDGKGVYLFNKYYTPDGVSESKSTSAVVFGDTHVKFLSKKVDNLNKFVTKKLNVEKEVYHDLHDHNIGSHHSEGNVIGNLTKALKNDFSLRDELMLSVKFLDERPNAIVVESNHHRHLDMWFNRTKPQNEHVNLPLYFELAELLKRSLEKKGTTNLFRLFIKSYCKNDVTFVDGNRSYLIEGIDVSLHGDIGPNGSRGSAKSLSRTGFRTVVGHSHSPCIEKGCYQVGTSTLDLGYATGYSTWMITNCIIYPNGKRMLYSIVKDKLSPLMRSL